MVLNDNIQYMMELLGEPETVAAAAEIDFDALNGKASENYITLLRHFGRCNWAKGRIQLVAPPDLQPIADMVLADDPDLGGEGAAYIYAFTAFGTVHFWHEKYRGGEIDLVSGMVFCGDLTEPCEEPAVAPLASMDTPFYADAEEVDFYDISGEPLFSRTLERLGEIGFLECYGFVPALALGGEPVLDRIRKNPALAHFAILAQSTDFTLVTATADGRLVEVRPVGK